MDCMIIQRPYNRRPGVPRAKNWIGAFQAFCSQTYFLSAQRWAEESEILPQLAAPFTESRARAGGVTKKARFCSSFSSSDVRHLVEMQKSIYGKKSS